MKYGDVSNVALVLAARDVTSVYESESGEEYDVGNVAVLG